ncbi:unnamed protein product [Discosporangium mesarthrocarpum]
MWGAVGGVGGGSAGMDSRVRGQFLDSGGRRQSPLGPESPQGNVHVRPGVLFRGGNPEQAADQARKRAAALEQQQALQEQIAAKNRVREAEEARRKREDEEEARQQEEWRRKMEEEAESERRQKQAEQQEQLQDLYRQQEEALQRRRGSSRLRPGMPGQSLPGDSGGHGPGAGGLDTPRSPRPPHSLDATESLPSHPKGVGYTNTSQGYLRANGPSIDDLPAGADARAAVLQRTHLQEQSGPPGSATELRGPPFQERMRSREGQPQGLPGAGVGGRTGWAARGEHGSGLRRKMPQGNARGSGATRRGEGRVETGAWGQGVGEVPEMKDEPPLPTYSSLRPITGVGAANSGSTARPRATAQTQGLDPIFGASGVPEWPGGNDRPAPIQRVESPGDVQQGLQGSQGGGGGGRKASAPVTAPDLDDEMDAFVISWQRNHLQRRSTASATEVGVGARQPHQGASFREVGTEHGGLVASAGRAAGGVETRRLSVPPVSSPSLLIGGGRVGGGGGGPGHGSTHAMMDDQHRHGEDLEESLAATSRLMGPLSSIQSSGAGTGARARGNEDGVNTSELSLMSDSLLCYLNADHCKAEEAGTGGPQGARSRVVSAPVANSMGTGHGSSERKLGAPWLESPPPQGAPGVVESVGADGKPLSPLTRLLAATHVQLEGYEGTSFGCESRNGVPTDRYGKARRERNQDDAIPSTSGGVDGPPILGPTRGFLELKAMPPGTDRVRPETFRSNQGWDRTRALAHPHKEKSWGEGGTVLPQADMGPDPEDGNRAWLGGQGQGRMRHPRARWQHATAYPRGGEMTAKVLTVKGGVPWDKEPPQMDKAGVGSSSGGGGDFMGCRAGV